MPRGKHVNHKGRNRRFTNPDELEEQRRREENAKSWRARNGQLSSESESEEGAGDKETVTDDSSEEDDDPGKAKGVEGIISIENPNRVQAKMKKLSTINETAAASTAGPQLTRREREELEKQRAAQHYQKLHAEGKTEEARADLARLAIIRQQREEAAKKREDEKKEKELAKQSKTSESLKAIRKR